MALDAALETAPTPNRDNFDGSVGYIFVAQRDLTITALGRVIGSTFAQNHKVILWKNDGTKLGEVTVTPSSPTENGWAYEMLASPVALTSGTTYRIASTEFASGDNWRDLALTTSIDAAFVSILGATYATTHDTCPTIDALTAGWTFAWPNMYEGSAGGSGSGMLIGGKLTRSILVNGGLVRC